MASRRAFATVEFALTVPLLLFFVAAAVDYSMLLNAAIAVGDAARAGAAYGSISLSNASNSAGMITAAENAAPNLTGLSATAVKTCECSNGSVVACSGGTCQSGAVRTYVQVTVQATVSALFGYPQLPYGGAVSAMATMRAQ